MNKSSQEAFSTNASTFFFGKPSLPTLNYQSLSYYWFIQRFNLVGTLASNNVTSFKEAKRESVFGFDTTRQSFARTLVELNRELSSLYLPSSPLQSTKAELPLDALQPIALNYYDYSALNQFSIECSLSVLSPQSNRESSFFSYGTPKVTIVPDYKYR